MTFQKPHRQTKLAIVEPATRPIEHVLFVFRRRKVVCELLIEWRLRRQRLPEPCGESIVKENRRRSEHADEARRHGHDTGCEFDEVRLVLEEGEDPYPCGQMTEKVVKCPKRRVGIPCRREGGQETRKQ